MSTYLFTGTIAPSNTIQVSTVASLTQAQSFMSTYLFKDTLASNTIQVSTAVHKYALMFPYLFIDTLAPSGTKQVSTVAYTHTKPYIEREIHVHKHAYMYTDLLISTLAPSNTIHVTAGADSRYGSYRRRLLRPSPTVLDRALPERASTDWVPARNVRAPDTDCLSRVHTGEYCGIADAGAVIYVYTSI